MKGCAKCMREWFVPRPLISARKQPCNSYLTLGFLKLLHLLQRLSQLPTDYVVRPQSRWAVQLCFKYSEQSDVIRLSRPSSIAVPFGSLERDMKLKYKSNALNKQIRVQNEHVGSQSRCRLQVSYMLLSQELVDLITPRFNNHIVDTSRQYPS